MDFTYKHIAVGVAITVAAMGVLFPIAVAITFIN